MVIVCRHQKKVIQCQCLHLRKRLIGVISDVDATSKKPRLDVDVKNMSSKQYMDEMVVPTMLRALSAVNKERPDDPIEFLIQYLSKEKEKSPGSPENPAASGSDPVIAATPK